MMDAGPLAEAVADIERRYAGRIAMDVRRLDAPGRFRLREHEVLPTASTCKLFVLCELLRQAGAGRVDLHAPLSVKPEYWCGGDGVLRAMHLPETLSAYNLAVLMIVASDNVATAAVIDLVGADNVARAVRDWGLRDTVVQARFDEWPRVPDAADPDSSAHDLCLLMTRLYRHDILDPAGCDDILRIMRAQRINDMLPRYVPVGRDWGDADEWIAGKTGYGSCVVEVGVVRKRDRAFSLAVFFKPDTPMRPRFKCLADHPPVLAVAEACRAVYESMTGPDTECTKG